MNDDCIYSIMKLLSVQDAYHFSFLSKDTYFVFRNDDRLWKKWLKKKFGKVNKEDVNIKDPTWYLVYKCFKEAYDQVKDDIKLRYETLLYRKDEKAMVIPLNLKTIVPRYGDVLIDLNDVGYRNQGVYFWNGAIIGSCYDFDDYGSVPLEFSWPEFPISYYLDIIDHNNYVNFRVEKELKVEDENYYTFETDGKRIMIGAHAVGEVFMVKNYYIMNFSI